MDVIIKGLTPEQAKEFADWLDNSAGNYFDIWFYDREVQCPQIRGWKIIKDTIVVQAENNE